MRRLRFLASFVIAGLASISQTQTANEDSVLIGLTRLTIGMTQERVMARLAENYDLQKMSNHEGTSFMVRTRSGQTSRILGLVAFTKGKLATAIRYWDPEDQQKGVEFAQSVIGAITELYEVGARSCEINVGTSHFPAGTTDGVWLVCGTKAISINVLRTSGQEPAATISEWAGKLPSSSDPE